MIEAVDATLAATNREAWDGLYRRTEALVWGDRPIGFLEEFAPALAPQPAAGARLLDAAAGEGRNLSMLLGLGAALWELQDARARADLPGARPLVYFLTLTDGRKATVSTEHEVLPGE